MKSRSLYTEVLRLRHEKIKRGKHKKYKKDRLNKDTALCNRSIPQVTTFKKQKDEWKAKKRKTLN